jgi:HEPN domain-containing protein
MNTKDIAAQIIDTLDLNERVRLANLPVSDFEIIEKVLARYLAERLKDENFPDMDEYASGEAHEVMKIVKMVWEGLRETHRLRIVK